LDFTVARDRSSSSLGSASHKGKVYTPADVRNTLIKRKKEIEADPGKAKPCERPTTS
jgi:hypothetical protein